MVKENVLVYDIETAVAGQKPNPEKDEFRIFGAYSFRYDKFFFEKDLKKVQAIIDAHDFVVGHNSSDKDSAYDAPILERHGISFKGKIQLDTMSIMVKRHLTMQIPLKRKSLKYLAEVFKLDVRKGELDYSILKKPAHMWSDIEEKEILAYLKNDVEITKQVFERVYDYYEVFKQFISQKDQDRLVWVSSTIANLGYLSMCYQLGLTPEYSGDIRAEDIGGLVREPQEENFHNLWYIDVASLYPSIIIMFNMFSNPTITPEETNWFEGNKVFEIKGKYGLSKYNIMSEEFKTMFLQRKPLKKSNPKLAYAYKILMNSGYGVLRSPIFKSTFYEHTGADICRIGQKINLLMSTFFDKAGFETVYGDTDSIFIRDTKDRPKDEQKEIVKKFIGAVVQYVKDNVPFPFEGFDIDIETGDMIDYLCFFYDKDTRKYKKKNYVMIHNDGKGGKEVEIKGLAIKKDNASRLGMHIYENFLEKKIIEQGHCKFQRKQIEQHIREELGKDMKLASVAFNVNPAESYKNLNQIQAQISRAYLDGEGGRIYLIKNRRIGKVGKGDKYCLIEEAKNLMFEDLVLDKVWNELDPFIIEEKPIDLMSFDETVENDDESDLFDEQPIDDDFETFTFEGKMEVTIKKEKGLDEW